MNFCEINVEDKGVFELFNYLEWAFSDLTKKVKSDKHKFEIAIMICSYVNKYADKNHLKEIKCQAIYELTIKWLTNHFPIELYHHYEIDKEYKLNLEDTTMSFYGIRNEYFYQKLIFNVENKFDNKENFEVINHLIYYAYDNPCFDFHKKGDRFKRLIPYNDLEPQSNFLNDEKFMFKKIQLFVDLQYQINASKLVSDLLININIEKHYDYELNELLNE